MKRYTGNVPDYRESLHDAVAAEIEALDRLNRWTAKGLELMEQLKKITSKLVINECSFQCISIGHM